MSTHPRAELALAQRQLEAIERFHLIRRSAEVAAAAASRFREQRMDTARRLEVLRVQHQTIVERTHEQLQRSGSVLMLTTPLRCVVAPRSAWFVDRLVAELGQRDVELVDRVENGAEAVGLVVAEQPDLLFVEERLLMVPGEAVARESRAYCPGLRIGAQTEGGAAADALRAAGADLVVGRQAAPADVAEQLVAPLVEVG